MSEIESKILDAVKDTLPALDDGKQQFLLGYVEGMAAATQDAPDRDKAM